MLDMVATTTARTPPAGLRRGVRHDQEAGALPVVLDRRGHPATRRGPRTVQSAVPGQRLAGRHPGRADGLPAHGAGVRRDRRPGGRPRAAAGVPPQPRAAQVRAARHRQPVRRGRPGSLRHAARRLACRRRGRAPDGRRGAAPRGGRAGRLRPPAAPALAPGAPDERPALGGPPLRRAGPARRWDRLALPLRPVRLDHAFLAAVRVEAAPDRFAAVPLRARVRPGWPRRGPRHPEELDGRGRREPAPLSRQRARGGRPRGPLHARRGGHPRLPQAHDRAGVHGDDAQRQGHVRRARVGIVLGLVATLAGSGLLGEEHNYRETVSVWFRSLFVLQPDVEAMAAAPVAVPRARPGRDAPVRDVAVHPARPRLHCARALPVPPLHRLPEPGLPAPHRGAPRRAAAGPPWEPKTETAEEHPT